MELEFTGEVVHWRGPAPHHFVTLPDEDARTIHAVAGAVTYGWGMIPAVVHIGSTSWETSLFPKDGGYLVPLRASVRQREGIDLGDPVSIRLEVVGP